jgi:hypothetical protein
MKVQTTSHMVQRPRPNEVRNTKRGVRKGGRK